MTTDVAAITAAALALPETDRADLLVRLMDSLDSDPFGSDALDDEAWEAEIARRIEGMRSGREPGIRGRMSENGCLKTPMATPVEPPTGWPRSKFMRPVGARSNRDNWHATSDSEAAACARGCEQNPSADRFSPTCPVPHLPNATRTNSE
jgi:putative addiction module component (TIGR02574 family)